MTTQANKKRNRIPERSIAFIILPIIMLAAAAFAGIYSVIIFKQNTIPFLFTVIAMILLGVISLFIVLVSTSMILSQFGMLDKRQALALPEGSVRALIALLLIIIFAIASLFLYDRIENNRTEEFIVTEDTYNALDSNRIYSSEFIEPEEGEEGTIYYKVQLLLENEDGTDFAKQLLTTISTLVVALAGFYFGTRSVAAAKGATAQLLPIIRKVNKEGEGPKAEGKENEVITLEIIGENFENPKAVELQRTDERLIRCLNIMSTKTEIRCTFTIPAGSKEGEKWDLYVRNEDGGEDTLRGAFEIIEKESG